MVNGYLETSELLEIVKKRTEGEKTCKQVALSLGISAQYLHDILERRRKPGEKLLRAIGYERVTLYKETGK